MGVGEGDLLDFEMYETLKEMSDVLNGKEKFQILIVVFLISITVLVFYAQTDVTVMLAYSNIRIKTSSQSDIF